MIGKRQAEGGRLSGLLLLALFFLAGVILGQVLSGRVPDGAGSELGRYLSGYVRLEEDGAIYALATDSIDAVMTISVAGMRGVVQEPAPAEGQDGE